VTSKSINVLIVDDEKYIGEIWEEIFLLLGCHVYLADSVDRAISVLTHHKIDLVITDLRMPEADGFVLLDYLSDSYPGDIYTFVCSGFHEETKSMLGRNQVIRVIPKPFSVMAELDYFRDFLLVS
jgi:CheY-like chemotaxis protein